MTPEEQDRFAKEWAEYIKADTEYQDRKFKASIAPQWAGLIGSVILCGVFIWLFWLTTPKG